MDIAAFVDRDGVITDLKKYNQESDLAFLNRKEDIIFFEKTVEAIKLLNKNFIKVVMMTNNPQVAKGMITEQEARSINQEIINALKKEGAIIDAVYFCPHHPNGIIKEYSIPCQCRKPLPGMIIQASREMNIDLRNSYVIGDRTSDIKAGELAGCKTIGVRTGYGCNDSFKDAVPEKLVDDFYEAARLIDRTRQNLKIFINNGGKGERLYPLTQDIPKPLVKIKGKPILHYLVDLAKKNNLSEIIMMNGYKAEKIIEYFGNGENFGIPIKHSNEPFPLGSGGPLKFAEKHADNTFFYVSGDLACEVDLRKMLDFHRKNNADATIFLHKSSHPQDSDILKINEFGQVIKFISKHDDHTDAGDLGNAGLVIMEPRVLSLMDSEVFNFENEIYPKMLNKKFKVMGYVSDELILDIGTIERLKIIEESNFGNNINLFIPGKKKMIIRSRAPARIEFGGGGTDLPQYFEKNGGFVINAAINKYAYASLKNFDGGIKINLENKNTLEFPNLKSIKYEGDLDLVRAIFKRLQIENKEIFLRNDATPNSGLGTNASLAIAILGAIYKLKDRSFDKRNIAEEAYGIISHELGVFGGKQNQFASAFGGINSIEFQKDGTTIINPINMSKDTLRELEKHLVLFYIGKRRNTDEILRGQKKETSKSKKIEVLDRLKALAIEMKNHLENGNLNGFAKCMEKEWMTKKIFDPAITNSYIDRLYEIAKRNGAISGKLMGAGGGGHMLFYAEPDKEPTLVEKLQENGAKVIDFNFDHEGLDIWEAE